VALFAATSHKTDQDMHSTVCHKRLQYKETNLGQKKIINIEARCDLPAQHQQRNSPSEKKNHSNINAIFMQGRNRMVGYVCLKERALKENINHDLFLPWLRFYLEKQYMMESFFTRTH